MSLARGDRLDTETAFTTIAILSMITHPANMVMTIVPRGVAAFAAFERIQAFLVRLSPKVDPEILPTAEVSFHVEPNRRRLSKTAVLFCQVTIGHRQALLNDVNIEVAAGSLTIISGPTGVGKSTLLRAVLGEVLPFSGSISVSERRIAYCAQKTWLPNGTVKQAIHGASYQGSTSDHDGDIWYREVIEMCCLSHDFDSLRDGEKTQIGSRGLNLSGGQRQRVVSSEGFEEFTTKDIRHSLAPCLQNLIYYYWMIRSVA